MGCCAFDSNGQAAAADVLAAFSEPRTTTDGALQSLRVAALPVVGAGVTIYATVFGIQDDAVNGFRFNLWADASRNAPGSGGIIIGTISSPYTDAVLPAWSTPGVVPAGWAIPALVVAANLVNITWSGAAGQNVRWRVSGTRSFVGGATA